MQHKEESIHALSNRYWYRSSRCTSGMCVEIRQIDVETVAIRDSKEAAVSAEYSTIELSADEFELFTREVVGDLPMSTNGLVDIERIDTDTTVFRCIRSGAQLHFTNDEVAAFAAGIRAGRFVPGLTTVP